MSDGGLKFPNSPAEINRMFQELGAKDAQADEPAGDDITSNMRIREDAHTRSSEAAQAETQKRRQAAARKRTQSDEQQPAQSAASAEAQAERDARLAKILQRIENDEVVPITLRLSAFLNDYVNLYVERHNRLHPKQKLLKQDVIGQALAVFAADNPIPKEPVIEDDLLG